MNLKQRLHSKTSFTPSRCTWSCWALSRYSSAKQTASPLSSQGFSMGLQLGFDQRITENLYRKGLRERIRPSRGCVVPLSVPKTP